MKIAVITSNFGNFDAIKQLPKQTIKYDRFYYDEKNSPYPAHTIDNRLAAKIFKIMPHKILPDYDVYIWIDGNVEIKRDNFVNEITTHLGKNDFCISPHPFRKNIYEEAEFIINSIKADSKYLSGRYSIEPIQREIEHIGSGLKDLYYCGIFARRNDPIVNQMCESWFMDNVLWTNFDQLNFISNINKYHLNIKRITFGPFYDNPTYKLHKHNRIS